MSPLEIPTQRVELRADGGPWIAVDAALAGPPGEPGFVVPLRELEDVDGRPVGDQVTCRLLLDLLEDPAIVRRLLEAEELEMRVCLEEAGTLTVQRPVFSGRVVEAARATTRRLGDTLELTALDRLAAAREIAPPPELIGTAPRRFDELVKGLAAAAGLNLVELPAPGLNADEAVVSHHPRPSVAGVDRPVRSLVWWDAVGLLLCGVGESVYAYDPARGAGAVVAVPPGPASTPPPFSLDALALRCSTLYGVAQPTAAAPPTAETRLIELELDGLAAHFGSHPRRYTIHHGAAPRLLGPESLRIRAREAYWICQSGDFAARGFAVGLAGPEFDGLAAGDPPAYSHHDGTYLWELTVRAWTVQFPRGCGRGVHDGTFYATNLSPDLFGRNLFLGEESRIEVEYDDDGRRRAPVVCYRMPGPLAYYDPRGDWRGTEGAVEDLGSFIPHAERVGELPLSLPSGYYAFISHGRPYDPGLDAEPAEGVAGFTLLVERPDLRPRLCAREDGGELFCVEDGVDPDRLGLELGPLAVVEDDEFERLCWRESPDAESQTVRDWPERTFALRPVWTGDDELLVACARDTGLTGAYGRREPLIELLIGRVSPDGDGWRYREEHRLGGWSEEPELNREGHSHYQPLAAAWSSREGALYLGVRRTIQRFRAPSGLRAAHAYVNWAADGGKRRIVDAWVLLDGCRSDDFAVGDRIRLWPEDPDRLGYAPLPRTITRVEYDAAYRDEETFYTRLCVSPPLDVTRRTFLTPRGRVVVGDGAARISFGIEEYRRDEAESFPWGAPEVQQEAPARELRHYLYRYTPHDGVLEIVDDARRREVETLTVGDDGLIEPERSFIEEESLTLDLGGTPLAFTRDEDSRVLEGESRLRSSRRYAGCEVEAAYDYWPQAPAFERLAARSVGCFYTRGARLCRCDDGAVELESLHHRASGVSSNLVVTPKQHPIVYGFLEGGGGPLFQYGRGLSGFVGDRATWEGGDIAACLAELALIFGCRLWVDPGGGLHLVGRDRRGALHRVEPHQVLDFRDPGPLENPPRVVRVSWAGGEQSAGSLGVVGSQDEERISSDLITSAGWARILARRLSESRRASARRRELTLDGVWSEIEPGDHLTTSLGETESAEVLGGIVVGLEPDCAAAATRIKLEGES